MTRSLSLTGFAALGLMALPPTLKAQTIINITPGSGLASNAAAQAAFNRAAQRWTSRITDPIAVNINANLANLGSGGPLVSTSPSQVQGSYTTIRNAMVADAAAEADDAIVASLPTAAMFSAVVPSGFSISGNIVLTTANARALGFSIGSGADGAITFNSATGFDFDNSDGVGAGLLDFESAAAREIGQVLGFTSAVDTVDARLAAGAPGAINLNPLDLFRFQNNVAGRDPATAAQFSSFPRYLVTGGDSIFDDISNEYRFSTGASTGDGRPASRWKDDALSGVLIGVMDPTLDPGMVINNSAADFRALDLIGYRVIPVATTVPEPGSVALLVGIGISGAGIMLKRRKPKTA